MKAKLATQKRLNKTLIAALTLMLGAISLLLCSPGSRAQQEPNRELVQTGSPRATNARRTALVIGNGAYSNAPPLKNPSNDARDMAATLQTLGFDVSSGVNVSQREMKRLIREFGQKLKAGGSGLFFMPGTESKPEAATTSFPLMQTFRAKLTWKTQAWTLAWCSTTWTMRRMV